MHPGLHSPPTATVLFAALLLSACDPEPPPKTMAEAPVSNVYLEALQDAESVKHSVEQRNLEQQRIDALIGAGRAQPPTR